MDGATFGICGMIWWSLLLHPAKESIRTYDHALKFARLRRADIVGCEEAEVNICRAALLHFEDARVLLDRWSD